MGIKLIPTEFRVGIRLIPTEFRVGIIAILFLTCISKKYENIVEPDLVFDL